MTDRELFKLAESTAAVKAVSQGYTKFIAIAVAGGSLDESEENTLTDTYPCGICLQFLSEFAEHNIRIVMKDRTSTLEDLLPNSFRL